MIPIAEPVWVRSTAVAGSRPRKSIRRAERVLRSKGGREGPVGLRLGRFSYDEIITCFSVDGTLEMDINHEGFQKLEPGDMVWLADGTPVTYRVKGEAVVLYSVTPTDWADRTPRWMREQS